jgi:hypothetical protein
MRLRTRDSFESITQLRIAKGELGEQVIPLVHELTARHHNGSGAPRSADLPRRKRVAAGRRFHMEAAKILGDRAAGSSVLSKSMQLRMMTVSVRPAPQHCLRQKRLAPQRNQAARVKVLGMNRPQTHRHRSA